MPLSAMLFALLTIAMWSFLATLGALLRHVPPFLLVGVALCVGGLIGLPQWRCWFVPWRTFAVGVYGLFGYHFLLFVAFQHAPAVEANLMNYLWPLLIVTLSPLFLPGFHLQARHVLGALVGMSGAALIVSGGQFSLDVGNLAGYLLAAGAAFVWSSYSLLSKRLPPFPTAAVGAFCLVSGMLSLGVYGLQAALDGQVYLPTASDWLYLTLLGLGPMGLAFFTWDAALKRGDPRIIGALAYLTPLASTLLLVAIGGRTLTWVSVVAMVLILAGAVIGSWNLIKEGAA